MIEVTVRVYGSLNDFLPAHRRHVTWPHVVEAHPSVKDLIESLGVPHPEIDLILVNGMSVPFDYAVRSADRIVVFPQFMVFDVRTLSRVRPPALEMIRFVADVHLGKLARHLRLIGLDTDYRADADDAALAELAHREGRILLTRDQALLKRRTVAHGYFIRETHPHRQLVEVLRRFGPLDLRPFSRCLRCNGVLRDVRKSAVDSTLLPRTRQHYHDFQACSGCGRVYWKGSHWKRLKHAIDAAQEEAERRAI
ncbi:MAG: Mut7-C ubiquitin/RNAse domain-containing protein [Acidobacteria bacterium]|nr:Mut7-C ubiquitin/RNAse domain-containing protein [Acidobacteriota bacterium]